MGRPVNPYVAGPALRGEKGFFGRRDTLEWVERELRNPATNALVLSGQRRIGKTSLLLRLQRTLPLDAFLPVYFDLQDQATRPLDEVLAYLTNTIARRANLQLPKLEAFDEQSHFFLNEFLPQLYRSLSEDRRPIFLLDEFDVLDRTAEEELPRTAAARTFFPFLRRLMTEDSRPAIVFSVGRQTDDLSLDFTATFKSSLVREIWVLDRESAEALVRQAEANGTLDFTDRAVDRILSLTNCHPYLTQLLCQRTWERSYAGGPALPPLINVPQVEDAIPDALEAGSQALVWLWDGLGPAEKIYAAALAETSDEGETISEDQAIQVLTDHAARLRTREVELAPRNLVKRRVVVETGEREYRFAVELIRRWVRNNRPLEEVKNELDRIEPVAERLYEVGRDFFNRQQWEDAVRFFQVALERNPRHFRARLHLGEALLEMGQPDEATGELERAYELDQEEARLPLARALMAQAKAQESAGDEDSALAACERALQISPYERGAQRMQAAIWTRRGDLALEVDDYDAALDNYEKAVAALEDARGLTNERVEAQDKVREAHEQRAKAAEAAEDWDVAAGDYEWLVNRDADNPRWREALRYAEAQSAMEQAKWTRAQEILHEIVKERPDYKDAARLLAEAIAASRGEKKRLVTLPRWAWVTGIVIVAILLLLGGILIGQKILTLTPTSVTPAGKTPAQASTITPTETATRALIVTPIPSPTAAATGAPTSTPSSTPTAIATDTPTPTDRPTRTPTPTVTPTHTSAPTDTPTQSPTHTATPTASPPEPVVPEQGHTYKNPVTFQWSGFLRSGQEYQVIARHPGSGDSIESELLTNPNWEFNLPGEKYGEWRWKVLVMQEGRIVATSPEWMFWFRPDGPAPTEGPPSTNTPPPTP